jgi:putative transposase
MKKGRFTEMQNVSALKKQESRIGVKDIAREMGISEATIYN